MVKCEDIAKKSYKDSTTFTIWYGGNARALKIAREKATEMANAIARKHLPICTPGDCSHAPKTVGGCACHPHQFYPHEQKCGSTCSFNVVMLTIKTWKTWLGTSAGTYMVGISGTCSCKCMPPISIGQPFDFLGLINTVAGGIAGGKKELPKTIADLIKWMQDNIKEEEK